MRITEYPSIFVRLSRSREYLPQLLSIFLLVALISPQSLLSYRSIIVFLGNLFLTAFTYTINDVEDAEDDYQDFKKRNRNLISNGTIGKGWGYIVSFSSLFTGLTFLFLLNKLVFIVGALLSLNSFLYSWKRLRLKSIPVLDLVSHAICLGALQFLTTYMTFRPLDLQILPFLIMIIPFSFSCQISQQLRDFEVDRKTKINNTTQLIGERRSIVLVYVFCALSAAGFVMLDLNRLAILFFFAFLGSLSYFKIKHHLPLQRLWS